MNPAEWPLLDEYFRTAQERYYIKLRREAGLPREQWTDDVPFQQWRFCNVHREDDKVTRWFKDNVRSKLSGIDVVKATVAFRWFNLPSTGEVILPHLLDTANWKLEEILPKIQDLKPVVTGAYIIQGLPGYTKAEGVLRCIEEAFHQIGDNQHEWEADQDDPQLTLQQAWSSLIEIPYMGRFMAYEVVSDLRWTDAVSSEDAMTWANAGPGCARGLSWVKNGINTGFNRSSERDQAEMLEMMRVILQLSKNADLWPAEWPAWEMREAEHWACEFDKYQRALRGNRMKRTFR